MGTGCSRPSSSPSGTGVMRANQWFVRDPSRGRPVPARFEDNNGKRVDHFKGGGSGEAVGAPRPIKTEWYQPPPRKSWHGPPLWNDVVRGECTPSASTMFRYGPKNVEVRSIDVHNAKLALVEALEQDLGGGKTLLERVGEQDPTKAPWDRSGNDVARNEIEMKIRDVARAHNVPRDLLPSLLDLVTNRAQFEVMRYLHTDALDAFQRANTNSHHLSEACREIALRFGAWQMDLSPKRLAHMREKAFPSLPAKIQIVVPGARR
jgi:hypothetical protein